MGLSSSEYHRLAIKHCHSECVDLSRVTGTYWKHVLIKHLLMGRLLMGGFWHVLAVF